MHWVALDTGFARSTRLVCACFVLLTACSVYDTKLSRSRAESQLDAGETSSRTDSTRIATGESGDAALDASERDASGSDAASCPIACAVPNARTTCERGHCVIASCFDGYRDCDSQVSNGCETAVNDPHHCGACDRVCSLEHGSAMCVGGECKLAACAPGFADCDQDGLSCETDLNSLENCGACGAACAQASCNGGVCSAADCTKMHGRADCDHDGASCEADLFASVEHCGRCGNRCTFDPELLPRAAPSCRDGVCSTVCEAGWGDCDQSFKNGCETPLNTLDDCGGCGQACEISNAKAVCRSGRCEVTRCDSDYADCDGDGRSCETSLATAEHCGSCTRGCALAHAESACRGAPSARACALVSCEDDWADCDGDAANGCERDVRSVKEGGLGPCEPDSNCTQAEFSGHTYFICSRPRSWDDARDTCQKQAGGDLAVLDTVGEQDFLRRYVRSLHWVGHTDQGRRGVWRFVTSGLVFWQAGLFLVPNITARWAIGEPSPFGDCAALLSTGFLGALVCAQAQPFVCEVTPP